MKQISSHLIVSVGLSISQRGDLRSRDIIIITCINGRREAIVFHDGDDLRPHFGVAARSLIKMSGEKDKSGRRWI